MNVRSVDNGPVLSPGKKTQPLSMPLKDQITNFARKLAERQPDEAALRRMVRIRKPVQARFKDDGIIPNHPRWPLLIYRGAVATNARPFDAATVIDALFAANRWGRSWRDSIYDFVHYHSRLHEVLGVARGSARVEFGGVKGRVLALRAGDIAVLPAGTGHRLIEASRNFLVVGAYPPKGTYDECTDTRDRKENAAVIARVKKPKTDPVYGASAGLMKLWE
jgi:uncharacterized protein YjlB